MVSNIFTLVTLRFVKLSLSPCFSSRNQQWPGSCLEISNITKGSAMEFRYSKLFHASAFGALLLAAPPSAMAYVLDLFGPPGPAGSTYKSGIRQRSALSGSSDADA